MGRYLETVHCPLGSNTHQDVHADGHNGFWNMERLGADVHDCDVQRACGSNRWKRSDAIRHEQPRLDRNVCMRRYILSVLQHHADVCADGSLSDRGLVWRSANVQQSTVPRTGAANEWWGHYVLFKSRCGLDSNVYM